MGLFILHASAWVGAMTDNTQNGLGELYAVLVVFGFTTFFVGMIAGFVHDWPATLHFVVVAVGTAMFMAGVMGTWYGRK